MEIARYWASLGFKVDQKEVKKVDTALSKLEKKLKALGQQSTLQFNVGKFAINQRALDTALGNALDKASKTVVFEIERFSVNRAALQSTMQRAMRGSVSVNAPKQT